MEILKNKSGGGGMNVNVREPVRTYVCVFACVCVQGVCEVVVVMVTGVRVGEVTGVHSPVLWPFIAAKRVHSNAASLFFFYMLVVISKQIILYSPEIHGPQHDPPTNCSPHQAVFSVGVHHSIGKLRLRQS